MCVSHQIKPFLFFTVHTLIIIMTAIILYTLTHINAEWTYRANTVRHGTVDTEKIKHTLTHTDGNAVWTKIVHRGHTEVRWGARTHTNTHAEAIYSKGRLLSKGRITNRDRGLKLTSCPPAVST